MEASKRVSELTEISRYTQKGKPDKESLHPCKNLLHPTVGYVILDKRKGKAIEAALSLITTVYTL